MEEWKKLQYPPFKVLTLGSPVVLSCQIEVREGGDANYYCQLHSSLCLGRLLWPNWTMFRWRLRSFLFNKFFSHLIFELFSDLTGEAVFLRTLYVCEFTEKSWKYQILNSCFWSELKYKGIIGGVDLFLSGDLVNGKLGEDFRRLHNRLN